MAVTSAVAEARSVTESFQPKQTLQRRWFIRITYWLFEIKDKMNKHQPRESSRFSWPSQKAGEECRTKYRLNRPLRPSAIPRWYIRVGLCTPMNSGQISHKASPSWDLNHPRPLYTLRGCNVCHCHEVYRFYGWIHFVHVILVEL